MRLEESDLVPYQEPVGSVSYGANHPRIFLRVCQVYRALNLDIIDVASHVRKGWLTMLIVARNKNPEGLSFARFRARMIEISAPNGFATECFRVPDAVEAATPQANVVIVLECENRVGFLASLLEVIDKYQLDIADIDWWVDDTEENATFKIDTYIPAEAEDFFATLEGLRADVHALGDKLGLKRYNSMVHSSETFEFIQKIDYEQERV
jgi:predicted amino acid-binding ACT domain protein